MQRTQPCRVSACVRVRQHMACVRQYVCGAVRLNDAPLWRRMLQHITPARPCASDVLRVDSCADRRARGCVEHCGDVLRLDDDIDSFMARDAAGATGPEGRHGVGMLMSAFCSVEHGAVITVVRSCTKR